METLLNVNQVAFILKVHPLTIRRYIKEGRLKAVRVGGNIRIKESELADFNSKEIKPGPKENASPFITPKQKAKKFSLDDPFFRLNGRGASLNLSTE